MALTPRRVHPKANYEQRVVNTIQDNLAGPLRELASKPHNDSQLIENINLILGTTLVQHKLGRKVRGFYVVDQNASATIFRDTASTADLTKYLPLTSSAITRVCLVVF
jgi:nitrate/nitrite-specific signal transduction histidine kinase